MMAIVSSLLNVWWLANKQTNKQTKLQIYIVYENKNNNTKTTTKTNSYRM